MNRVICSWDVGIKNLAYCILEDVANQEPHIISWGIINLVEDDIIKCDAYQKKTGNKCTKNATLCGPTWCNNEGNNEENDEEVVDMNLMQYYCGQHKADYKGIPQKYIDDWSDKSSGTCMHQMKNKICGKKAKWSHNESNIYLCTTHYKSTINKLTKKYSLQSLKKFSAYRRNLQTLVTRMVEKLDNIPELLEVTHVLIENQPSLINPTMKSISSFLFSYLVQEHV